MSNKPVAFRHYLTGEFCTGGFNRNEIDKWIPLYEQPQKQWIGLDQTTKPDIRHQTETFFAGVQWAETRLKELNHETQ